MINSTYFTHDCKHEVLFFCVNTLNCISLHSNFIQLFQRVISMKYQLIYLFNILFIYRIVTIVLMDSITDNAMLMTANSIPFPVLFNDNVDKFLRSTRFISFFLLLRTANRIFQNQNIAYNITFNDYGISTFLFLSNSYSTTEEFRLLPLITSISHLMTLHLLPVYSQ